MESDHRPEFILHIRAQPDEANRPPDILRLRALLKRLVRDLGFRCLEVRELPPAAPPAPPLTEAVASLRAAGGKAWDGVDDPAAFLRETTGGEADNA